MILWMSSVHEVHKHFYELWYQKIKKHKNARHYASSDYMPAECQDDVFK